MESFFKRYRNAVVLALVLGAQLLGLAVQIKRPGPEGSPRLVQSWAVALITPCEKAVVYSIGGVRYFWDSYINLHGVWSENQQLRREVEQMRAEQTRLREDAQQARRIQALLQFKEQYIANTVAAQVIGTSGSESSRIVYLDRGSEAGLRADMPVITPSGVVGKILHAFNGSSQVLLISDQTSGVGAILVKSRSQGVVKGSPTGEIALRNIMSDEALTPGDWVVTSGGDRVYPKGLLIGQVVSYSGGRDNFLNIKLRPAADLNRLEEVLVVTEIKDQLPDVEPLGPIRAADILAQRLPGVPQAATPQDAAANGKNATAPAPANGKAVPSAAKPQPAEKKK